MATINFYLDKPDKKGLAPIHLRINCSGTQIKLATGQKIAPELFDKQKQRAKGLTYDIIEINHYLNYLNERADELLHHSNKRTYTQEEIKDILKEVLCKKIKDTDIPNVDFLVKLNQMNQS